MYTYFSVSIKYLPSFILCLAGGKTFQPTFINGVKLLTCPGRPYVKFTVLLTSTHVIFQTVTNISEGPHHYVSVTAWFQP